MKKTWALRIIAAGLLLTILGFSVPYMISLKDNIVTYVIQSNQVRSYDKEQAIHIRDSTQQMKQSLAVDGRGIFYAKELKNLLPKTNLPSVIVVPNPYLWLSEKEWEEQLLQADAELQLPSTLSEALLFLGGQKEHPFGGFLSINDLSFVDELMARVKEENLEQAWIALPSDSDKRNPVFTTLYKNQADERIYITMELFSDKSQIQTIAPVTKQEQLLIGKQPVTYTLTEPFLFSDSDLYQSVFWLDSLGDKTVMYTVGSPEAEIGKTELTSIAEQFVH